MKKEYVYQHKYNGYCGESSDLVASLLNKLSAPVESGYYMDKTCQLYKWSELKKCFIRKADEFNSPLLTDYDFSKNNIVIRKEYSGKK